jgi:hypothetical protein
MIAMKTIASFFLALCCIVSQAQYNNQNLKLEESTVFRYEKLQVFPIKSNNTFKAANKHVGKYASLKDAMSQKKLVVKENGYGDVNSLEVVNTSKDTIMVLGGEVVVGGKQDRMIANDVIIYPNSKKKVEVFCVEQGRWETRRDGATFKESAKVSSNEVRKAAVVDKNQNEVWNKVATNVKSNKVTTSTGTLAAIQNSGELQASLKKYSEYFNKVIVNDPDVIGVVAVSGDKILGCDMFANHNLFQKHYANLIDAYATEAITFGGSTHVPFSKVKSYLDTFLMDEKKQDEEIKKKGGVLKDGGKKVHISTF